MKISNNELLEAIRDHNDNPFFLSNKLGMTFNEFTNIVYKNDNLKREYQIYIERFLGKVFNTTTDKEVRKLILENNFKVLKSDNIFPDIEFTFNVDKKVLDEMLITKNRLSNENKD